MYSLLRRIVSLMPLVMPAVWVSWFGTLFWWSFHRPHSASAALGLTHYVKTPVAVVYVGKLEAEINSGFQEAVLVLTLVFVASGFWLRFGFQRQERPR